MLDFKLMKRILSIILLVLFSSNISYAAKLSDFDVGKKEREEDALKRAKLRSEATREKITNEWLKDKTVYDLKELGFFFGSEIRITTTDDNVQYHLYKSFRNNIFDTVYVICFVDVKRTTCRLP